MAVTAERAYELMAGAHQRQRLAHAFLITGPVGSGKEGLAARVIELVNPPAVVGDLFGDAGGPAEAADLDSLQGEFCRIVRPRSKSRRILVSEIRELERQMYLAAPSGKWKVGVIVEVDRMFEEAANAFLKTLEEPPPGCLLLLLTAHSETLLPTVRSRCVEIVLQATTSSEVLNEAERTAFAEVLARTAEKPSAHGALLLKASFESLFAARRAAIERVNEAAFKEESDAYKQASEGDWLDERENYYAALTSSECLGVRTALVDWLVGWLGDAVRQKVGAGKLEFPELALQTRRFAEGQEMDALLRRLDVLQELQELLGTNVSEALAIEVSFLRAFGE